MTWAFAMSMSCLLVLWGIDAFFFACSLSIVLTVHMAACMDTSLSTQASFRLRREGSRVLSWAGT